MLRKAKEGGIFLVFKEYIDWIQTQLTVGEVNSGIRNLLSRGEEASRGRDWQANKDNKTRGLQDAKSRLRRL